MVLGLRTKTHKSPSSLELDFVVHIVEVKPWPSSQSLRTLRSVVIHWEHSDGSCGFTNQAVPRGDGRIEFNESFGVRDEGDTYEKKKCIEFNLYEPRWDKGLKGQLLATAVLDLAAYGVIKEDLSISTPIYCKRTYRNAAQPLLFLKIQQASSVRESVSALMSEEYAEEASFTTDDHVYSHSSPNKKVRTRLVIYDHCSHLYNYLIMQITYLFSVQRFNVSFFCDLAASSLRSLRCYTCVVAK